MSKAVGGQERAPGSWVWRAVRIAAIVLLVVSLLTWFLVDPLDLPGNVMEGLNQRASVIGMFTGAAGLVVAMLGLRVQLRSRSVDDIASTTGTLGAGQAQPAHALRRRTVLLIAAVSAVVVTLIVLTVVPDAPIRYEAEKGIPHNAQGHYGAVGASNDASMGMLNFPDSWVDIEVQAPRTGTFMATVQYAAGDGNARHNVTVNGGSTKYILDYQYSGWTTWRRVSIELALVQGRNTLRFQHGDGPFAAELDYVEIA
ncbi:hypothetical protein [Nonomuraea sp. LPB2021202275-12-8]|uniref:hypothetical protein n=1 Tax=Nonomuraea sp. LPB2021202275-12-8 TaxID=3120159 RepID=UPI00300C4589